MGQGGNMWCNLYVVYFHGEGNGNDLETAVDLVSLETAFVCRLPNFIFARRQYRWRKFPETEWLNLTVWKSIIGNTCTLVQPRSDTSEIPGNVCHSCYFLQETTKE